MTSISRDPRERDDLLNKIAGIISEERVSGGSYPSLDAAKKILALSERLFPGGMDCPTGEYKLELAIEGWQEKTFPDSDTDSIARHIHEEMKEFWDCRDRFKECDEQASTPAGAPSILCDPEGMQLKVIEELADIFLLSVAYASRVGKSFMSEVARKHRTNLGDTFVYDPEKGYAKRLTEKMARNPPPGWSEEEFKTAIRAEGGQGGDDSMRAVHIIAGIQARKRPYIKS